MPAFHLTFATQGRMPVAPGEALRRAFVRAILRVAGKHLALFCVVDDHVHVVLSCKNAEAHRVGRALVQAMRAITETPIDPAHYKPVVTRAHAVWLVGYCLKQLDHHGIDRHPALWSGSCVSELVGTRAVPGWSQAFDELLPRVQPEEALTHVGLPPEPLVLATDDQVRRAGAWRLVAAASFAAGADPALPGRAPEVVAARRAAARIGLSSGIAEQELAAALDVGTRHVGRLTKGPVTEAVERATRARIELEDRVIAAAKR